LFASRITDVRELVVAARRARHRISLVTMSMGDAAARDRFHVLEEWTGHRRCRRCSSTVVSSAGRPNCLPIRASPGVPGAATWLGYAGLLPFVAALLGFLLSGEPRQAYFAQQFIAYGAVILSFVGAVHWGSRSPGACSVMRMSISILPALLAWAALLLPVRRPRGCCLRASSRCAPGKRARRVAQRCRPGTARCARA
jgi:hypothetical protein